ncbi:hypothetical protein SAMN02745121_00796 [Nannocystis exedens]|uniref:Uncharacterized protein n=1 Tax=Nannocystis exedens TaxID=54 RepID=A0A1I1TLI7_9BACT|nr:hypothetical protein [Nannocystis exedens]PCC66440.1 hypothetical protein NAEX_09028 [Nannocystis exedens]SFD59536.1 hypothetical protein SAMN02745121_00796 [Nannocystis exedens]
MSRRASLLALVVAPCISTACNSDDLLGGLDQPDTTSTGTGTTTTTGEPPTTGELTTTTTTTSGGDTTTGASSTTLAPEPPPTCDELLDCVLPCALGFDLECAQMCADGLSAEEAGKAFDLALCVGMACFESEACTTETLMDPVCLACIGFLLMDDNPAGCEAEAEACAGPPRE